MTIAAAALLALVLRDLISAFLFYRRHHFSSSDPAIIPDLLYSHKNQKKIMRLMQVAVVGKLRKLFAVVKVDIADGAVTVFGDN